MSTNNKKLVADTQMGLGFLSNLAKTNAKQQLDTLVEAFEAQGVDRETAYRILSGTEQEPSKKQVRFTNKKEQTSEEPEKTKTTSTSKATTSTSTSKTANKKGKKASSDEDSESEKTTTSKATSSKAKGKTETESKKRQSKKKSDEEDDDMDYEEIVKDNFENDDMEDTFEGESGKTITIVTDYFKDGGAALTGDTDFVAASLEKIRQVLAKKEKKQRYTSKQRKGPLDSGTQSGWKVDVQTGGLDMVKQILANKGVTYSTLTKKEWEKENKPAKKTTSKATSTSKAATSANKKTSTSKATSTSSKKTTKEKTATTAKGKGKKVEDKEEYDDSEIEDSEDEKEAEKKKTTSKATPKGKGKEPIKKIVEEEEEIEPETELEVNDWGNFQDPNGYVFMELPLGTGGSETVYAIGVQDQKAKEKGLDSVVKFGEEDIEVIQQENVGVNILDMEEINKLKTVAKDMTLYNKLKNWYEKTHGLTSTKKAKKEDLTKTIGKGDPEEKDE
jgi:hypothetical protein